MFFLLRSACCIGVVVAALPDPSPQAGRPLLVPTQLEELCRAVPDRCVAIIEQGLRTGSAEAFALLGDRVRSKVSRDSLTTTDRQPIWNGPAPRVFD